MERIVTNEKEWQKEGKLERKAERKKEWLIEAHVYEIKVER